MLAISITLYNDVSKSVSCRDGKPSFDRGHATLLPEGIRKIGLFLANQGAASCRIQAYTSIWKIKVNMNEEVPPESTMRDEVKADYRNGLLRVHLPKDPAGKTRSINVAFEPVAR